MPANDAMLRSSTPEGWRPLLELAVREVFQIMLGATLHPPRQNDEPGGCEFTAMVGLAGQLCGVLTLRTSASTAALIASRMLGIAPQQANEHMWDAIGEVCNMIAGSFKTKLPGIGDGCMLSVPTVITGADYVFHSLANGGSLEIGFSFEGAPLIVALELHI